MLQYITRASFCINIFRWSYSAELALITNKPRAASVYADGGQLKLAGKYNSRVNYRNLKLGGVNTRDAQIYIKK